MLTLIIRDEGCDIEGSASCQEIMAACSALLHTTYDFLKEEGIAKNSFEEFLNSFSHSTTKAYHLLLEKESLENDNTCISTGSLRKLS